LTTARVTKCTDPEIRALRNRVRRSVRSMLTSLRKSLGPVVHSNADTEAAIIRLLVAAIAPCGRCDYCRHNKRQRAYVARQRKGETLTQEEAKRRRAVARWPGRTK